MSIGVKYMLTFSISVILFIVATATVYIQLQDVKGNVSDIIQKNKLMNDMSELALLGEKQGALISDYIIIGNIRSISEIEELNKEVLQLTGNIEDRLTDEGNLFILKRLRENTDKITNMFTSEIAVEDANNEDIIYAQIQIGALKKSNVASINRLIESVTEEQQIAENNVHTSIQRSVTILLTSSIVSIITGFLIMVIISRIISTYLKRVVNMTKEVSKGNLAVEKIDYNGKDEIGQLSFAVNQLVDNMRDIIHKVNLSSTTVSERSELLKDSSKEIKASSEQMVITMEELAQGAESQADHATDLAEKMQQFVEIVQLSQQKGQSIATDSGNVLTHTSDGMTLMQQSVQQMGHIDEIVAKAVERVRGLDKQSNEITKLVQVVKEIADQTNLLALNAAIEAARAGEHGRGFAVVADEVRKLAEQVNHSISDITKIVSSIQKETYEVSASLDDGYQEVKEGIKQIEKTGESFQIIDGSITSMATDITEIADRLNNIAQNSEQMNQLIENIAAVSEESAAGVEQTSASTQQASSTMDEISHNANELSDLAVHLHEEISVFTLPEEETENIDEVSEMTEEIATEIGNEPLVNEDKDNINSEDKAV